MPTVILDVDITTALVDAWFEYAGYKVRDPRSPLRRSFYQTILPSVMARFENEGYGEWEELSKAYEKEKFAAGYGGKPILERTGDGKRAIYRQQPHITRDGLSWAPHSDYMHWHQSGGYVAGRPPQRTWLELDEDDEDQIEAIFQVWLDELADSNTRRVENTRLEPPVPDYYILGL